MKFLKTLLKIILAGFTLLTAFVLFCAFHPAFTEKIASLLHGTEEAFVENRESSSETPVFYPYYEMLDEKEKGLYNQIYDNACQLVQRFVPEEEIQAEQLDNVFIAVYNDHPELFYMETAYYCDYTQDGICVDIQLIYNQAAQNYEAGREAFESRAGEIIAAAEKLEDDYQKEKYVHDLLVKEVSYNPDAAMGQSAYGALVEGEAVCAGYTRAFQYLLQQLGIPCYYCNGYAGESHAWNLVYLSDGFYNVDVTWDDTEEEAVYFNQSDADFAATHLRQDMSLNLPSCDGKLYRNN
jgi:transglutaminase-like putative cysteine protease